MARLQEAQASASVCAAAVAAELDRASQVARQLSLTAKNARVVVMRAGNRAASLKVISDFFDDLASKTIALAKNINVVAIDISRLAVSGWRDSMLISQLHRSAELANQWGVDVSLNTYTAQLEMKHEELVSVFHKKLNKLASELSEIQRLMRAANVISVTSRLEATQTGEFEGILVEMANTIQSQSDQIKLHVSRSQQILESTLNQAAE